LDQNQSAAILFLEDEDMADKDEQIAIEAVEVPAPVAEKTPIIKDTPAMVVTLGGHRDSRTFTIDQKHPGFNGSNWAEFAFTVTIRRIWRDELAAMKSKIEVDYSIEVPSSVSSYGKGGDKRRILMKYEAIPDHNDRIVKEAFLSHVVNWDIKTKDERGRVVPLPCTLENRINMVNENFEFAVMVTDVMMLPEAMLVPGVSKDERLD